MEGTALAELIRNPLPVPEGWTMPSREERCEDPHRNRLAGAAAEAAASPAAAGERADG